MGLNPLIAEPPLFRIAVIAALAMRSMTASEAVIARLLGVPNGHAVDDQTIILLSHDRLPSVWGRDCPVLSLVQDIYYQNGNVCQHLF